MHSRDCVFFVSSFSCFPTSNKKHNHAKIARNRAELFLLVSIFSPAIASTRTGACVLRCLRCSCCSNQPKRHATLTHQPTHTNHKQTHWQSASSDSVLFFTQHCAFMHISPPTPSWAPFAAPPPFGAGWDACVAHVAPTNPSHTQL